jgi:hypothetical protein
MLKEPTNTEDYDRRFLLNPEREGFGRAAVMIEDSGCDVRRTFILSYAIRDLPSLPSAGYWWPDRL